MPPDQPPPSIRHPQADYTVILLDRGAGPVSGQRVTVDEGIRFGEANFTL